MMMHSVELYRRIGDESEFDPGWVECGGIKPRLVRGAHGGAPPPGRLGEDVRLAARADLGGRGEGEVPADVDRRRSRRRLASDRRLPRSVAAHLRDGRRRPARRREDLHLDACDRDRGHGRARRRRRDRPRPDRVRGRRERERHVRGGDRPAGGSAGAGDPDVPPVRGDAAGARALRRASASPPCATPTSSSTTARTAKGSSWAATSTTRSRRSFPDGTGGFDEIPPDFNGRLLEDEPDRFEEIAENSKIRVPAMKDAKITKLINGPEAFTPDNEFCLGETEVAGLLRRRRVLRARPCRRGRDRNGHGRVDLGRRAVARPLEHGRAPLRGALPLARLHARPDPGDLRDLLRHPLPQPRAGGGASPTASRPQTAGTRSTTPPSARSPAGSGSTGTSRTPRAGRRVAPPARLGRDALVARDRRRAPGDARVGGALRRVVVREDGDLGTGRRRVRRRPLRQPRRARRSARSPTRRC